MGFCPPAHQFRSMLLAGIEGRRDGSIGRCKSPGHIRRRGRGFRAIGCFWVWLSARCTVGATGDCRDLAVDTHRFMDRLAQVFGMVRAAEGARQSGRGEGKREDLAVKGTNLGVGLHERPGAAFDLGQRLQDFRPRAAEDLDVACGSGAWRRCGGRRRSRSLSGRCRRFRSSSRHRGQLRWGRFRPGRYSLAHWALISGRRRCRACARLIHRPVRGADPRRRQWLTCFGCPGSHRCLGRPGCSP